MDPPLHLFFILWFGFFGLMHTLMPCEDKTIFAFYTFGASRDSKEAFAIITMYGLGLLLANMVIGTIATLIGATLFSGIKQTVLNSYSAISIILSGSYLLYKAFRRDLNPHPKQSADIKESFSRREGRFRKRSSFVLGILSGIPPCIFELTVYSVAASAQGVYGIAITFFFSIGTIIGLYGLAAMGIGTWLAFSKTAEVTTHVNPRKIKGNFVKKEFLLKDRPVSRIEIISALALIILGIILLIIAISGINIYDWIVIPDIPQS